MVRNPATSFVEIHETKCFCSTQGRLTNLDSSVENSHKMRKGGRGDIETRYETYIGRRYSRRTMDCRPIDSFTPAEDRFTVPSSVTLRLCHYRCDPSSMEEITIFNED